MIKNFTRSLSVFLIMIMVLIVVATGCSRETEKNTAGQNTTTEKAGEPEKPKASEPEKPKERVTITVNIRDMGTVDPLVGTSVDNFFTEWLEENAPVKLNMIPLFVPESKEKISMMFAAGLAPDLIMHPWQGQMVDWASQELLMPLDDLITTKSTNYKNMWEATPGLQAYGKLSDGNTYFLNAKMPLQPNHVMFIRKDWLDKLGLKVPDTVDDFFEVVKAFTLNDPDGNGQNDTYGFDLAHINGTAVLAMFKAEDWKISGNKLVRNFEHAKEAYAFKKKMFDAGLVDPDFLVDKIGNNAKQRFLNGKLGIIVDGWSNINVTFMNAFEQDNPGGEMIPIPLPTTKYGQFSPAVDMPYQHRYAINAKTKYANEIMEYIDWTMEPDVVKVLSKGFEGRHYNIVDNIPVPVQTDEATRELHAIIAGFYGEIGYRSAPLVLPREWWDIKYNFDLNDPVQKKVYDIHTRSFEIYTSPKYPVFYDILGQPVKTEEIQLIEASVNESITDMWIRSIVQGNAYTVEQAYADIIKVWKAAGGDSVEEYYSKWFSENQSIINFTKRWYE